MITTVGWVYCFSGLKILVLFCVGLQIRHDGLKVKSLKWGVGSL